MAWFHKLGWMAGKQVNVGGTLCTVGDDLLLTPQPPQAAALAAPNVLEWVAPPESVEPPPPAEPAGDAPAAKPGKGPKPGKSNAGANTPGHQPNIPPPAEPAGDAPESGTGGTP